MTLLTKLLEQKILPFVEKPLRYTGSEINIVRKEMAGVRLHGVLCFPDLYDIGMSHLGLQILYHLVNREPAWALSRCFHPWSDAEELLRRHAIPLYSLEYATPLGEADFIGFSVQYELHYTNLVNMLDLGGIPILQRDRRESDPIVISGGPCMGNPEPIADFLDAAVIGDGEEVIVGICSILERMKEEGASREEKLGALAALDGVYVPSRFLVESCGRFSVSMTDSPVRAAKVAALKADNYPSRSLVPIIDVVHHRYAVEVMRGCTRGCRFCAAGTYYRPVREKEPGELCAEIERGICSTGWREVGLLSLSTADYSSLGGLLDAVSHLKERYRIAFALPSTRIDALTPEQFAAFTAVSKVSSMTIAPEAGSLRLRTVINKDFTDEAIFSMVKTLLDRNVQTIKLYFMVGLPTETREDISAIVALVERIATMAAAKGRRCAVNVAISPFSPKAHTPFQREAFTEPGVLEERSRFIKSSLRRLRNVKVSYRDVRMALLETVMARGDRRVGELVLEAWKRGARFDGWDERFDFGRWDDAARETGVALESYLEAILDEQSLPWSVVSTGVTEAFLRRERERAYGAISTPDCREGDCSRCGACDDVPPRKATSPQAPVSWPRHTRLSASPERLCHYRIVYSKGPAVRFLGHIDMMAVFVRAFIAAGFDLQYTQGFKPHPKVSFGPPLPFSALGDAEALDIVTGAPIDGNPLRINAMLPPDLAAQSCTLLNAAPALSLNLAITAGRYTFSYDNESGDMAVRESIDRLLGSASLPVTVIKGGKTKTKDIRPLIRELRVDSDGVEAVLSMLPGATCKPAELAALLFPDRPLNEILVTRRECLMLR